MRAYRKVNDLYEFRMEGGRLALLGVGAGLVLVLTFLLGVLVGKALWGGRRTLPPLPQAQVESQSAPEPASPPPPAEEPARPEYTFYEELKKPDPLVPPPPVAAPAPRPVAPAASAAAPEAAPAAPRPAPPPAPPARAAARPPSAVFTVQVGSFQDRATATAMAREVGAQGVSAQVSEAFVAGRTWYRVQVGQFETRTEAENYYRARLRNKGVQGFVTTR